MLIRKQIFVHYGSIFINVSLTTKFQIEQYFYTLTVSSMYVDIQKKRFITVLRTFSHLLFQNNKFIKCMLLKHFEINFI